MNYESVSQVEFNKISSYRFISERNLYLLDTLKDYKRTGKTDLFFPYNCNEDINAFLPKKPALFLHILTKKLRRYE